MIKARYGSKIDDFVKSVLPFLFKRPINPDLLTLIGTAVSVVAAICFGMGHLVLGGFVLMWGGLFDLIDGVVARHFGISTRFGALLDSSMDRLVDMVVLLGIVLHFGIVDRPGMALLTAVVLVSSVMTSYIKARAELFMDVEMKGGLFERGERIVGIGLGGLFGLLVPILWILAIGGTYTVIQRFVLAHRALQGPLETNEAPEPVAPAEAPAPLAPPSSLAENS